MLHQLKARNSDFGSTAWMSLFLLSSKVHFTRCKNTSKETVCHHHQRELLMHKHLFPNHIGFIMNI